MKQSIFNTILGLTIIVLVIIIGYRYMYSNYAEHFEDNSINKTVVNNMTPNTTSNNTVLTPPESTYNLQQYIESNPPTGSQVIKKEIKHELPDLMDKDITMSQNKHIRFGTMRGEVGTDKDTFYFSSESDSVTPKLKLVMEDKENKNPTFQIHGGACSEGNCSLEGPPLYQFDSQPNLKINDKKGEAIHELKPNGDVWHKGKLTAQELYIKGDLKVDGKINGDNGGSFSQGGEESKNMYIHGTSNAKDINVRNRLYFSNTPKGKSPYPDKSTWGYHDTDPMYIEKVRTGKGTGGYKNSLRITINDDTDDSFDIYGASCSAGNCRGPGQQLMNLDGNGNQWNRGNINAKDVNVRGRIYFSQTPVGGDPRGYLQGSGSAQKAQFDNWHHTDPFYVEKVRDGNKSILRITINDDVNDSLEVWGGSCKKNIGNWCRNEGNLLFKVDGEGTVWGKKFKTF